MAAFYRIVTVVLLVQALTLMIAELDGNYGNVPFEDMRRVSIWTGGYQDSKSEQVFFSTDKSENGDKNVVPVLGKLFKVIVKEDNGFSM